MSKSKKSKKFFINRGLNFFRTFHTVKKMLILNKADMRKGGQRNGDHHQ